MQNEKYTGNKVTKKHYTFLKYRKKNRFLNSQCK